MTISFLPLDSINVGERVRKKFERDKLDELKTSISDTEGVGLINAISVDHKHTLIAGEYRLKAITELFQEKIPIRFNGTPVELGKVPAIVLPAEINEVQTLTAELVENLRRSNFNSTEIREGLSRLALAKASLRLDNPNVTLEEVTIRDIENVAQEVYITPTRTNVREVKTAVAIEKLFQSPEKLPKDTKEKLQSVKSLRNAEKEIKRLERDQLERTLNAANTAKVSIDRHIVYNAQFIQQLPKLPAEEKFDVCIAILRPIETSEGYLEWLNSLTKTLYYINRVMSNKAYMFLWCDRVTWPSLKDSILSCTGEHHWTVERDEVICNRLEGYRPQENNARAFNKTASNFLFCRRGDRTFNFGLSQVISCKNTDPLDNSPDFPSTFFVTLLNVVGKHTDRVLSVGSLTGSSIIACQEVGMTCTAIEPDTKLYEQSLKRLKNLHK